MYDTTTIPSKHQQLTASYDDFGQYGSIFAPESDHQIPQPVDLLDDQPTPTETAENSNAVRLQ